MASWSDEDSFKLVHNAISDACSHAIRPGVVNMFKRYSATGDVLPICTNGDVITAWWSNDYADLGTTNHADLATMIRRTKPEDGLPVLIISIPEIEQAVTGIVAFCWGKLYTAETMRLYRQDGLLSDATFKVPPHDKDPVQGFDDRGPFRHIGTPHIYYDWREALTPIANYFKAVIKYCKDTGKARRLMAESASRALNDRNESIRAVISKNTKRFKNIKF